MRIEDFSEEDRAVIHSSSCEYQQLCKPQQIPVPLFFQIEFEWIDGDAIQAMEEAEKTFWRREQKKIEDIKDRWVNYYNGRIKLLIEKCEWLDTKYNLKSGTVFDLVQELSN